MTMQIPAKMALDYSTNFKGWFFRMTLIEGPPGCDSLYMQLERFQVVAVLAAGYTAAMDTRNRRITLTAPKAPTKENPLMESQEPKCFTRGCRHFIGAQQDADGTEERLVCAAFPNGIPEAIAYGDDDHTSPHPGDGGVQFEEGPADE